MLTLLLNPGRKRRKHKARKKARNYRHERPAKKQRVKSPMWKTSHMELRGVKTGMWTNPAGIVTKLTSNMKNTVIPLAAGAVGNMLLRPKLQQVTGFGGTPWKNAAVGVGSALVLGLGTGLVARKYAARVMIGALVQTAVTTVIEMKAGMAVAAAPALPAPAPAAAPTTAKGLSWDDAGGFDGMASEVDSSFDGLEFTPEMADAEL